MRSTLSNIHLIYGRPRQKETDYFPFNHPAPFITSLRCRRAGKFRGRISRQGRLRDSVGGNGPHVLGALEGAGRGTIFLAQAALELLDRFVFMLLHPGNKLAFDDADLPDTMPDER